MELNFFTTLFYISEISRLVTDSEKRRSEGIRDVGTVSSPSAKVVLLGDTRSGKTQTVRRLLGQDFQDTHNPTRAVQTISAEWKRREDKWQRKTHSAKRSRSRLHSALSYYSILNGRLFSPRLLSNYNRENSHRLRYFIFYIGYCVFGLLEGMSGFPQHLFSILYYPMLQFVIHTIFHFFFIETYSTRTNSVINFILFSSVFLYFSGNMSDAIFLIYTITFFIGLLIGYCLRKFPIPYLDSLLLLLLIVRNLPFIFIKSYLLLHIQYSLLLVYFINSITYLKKSSCLGAVYIFMPSFLILECLSTKLIPHIRWRFEYDINLGLKLIKVSPNVSLWVACELLAAGLILSYLIWPFTQKDIESNDNIPMPRLLPTSMIWLRLLTYFSALYATYMTSAVIWEILFYVNPVVAFVILLGEYQYQLFKDSDFPLEAIIDRELSGEDILLWPVQLSIADFSGDRRFQALLHSHFSHHTVFLVLFRLPDLCRDFDGAWSSILFWLRRAYTFVGDTDAKICIVATHARLAVDARRKQRVLTRLHSKLDEKLLQRLCRKDERSFVFLIDNKETDALPTDFDKLKEAIWDFGHSVPFVNLPNRIGWLHFQDFLSENADSKSTTRVFMKKTAQLWAQLRQPCRLTQITDFYRMLQYFNGTGDIFFMPRHFLFQDFVVLHPPTMEIILTRLVSFNTPIQPTQPAIFVTRAELADLSSDVTDNLDDLLTALKALGVVLALRNDDNRFLLTINLQPRGQSSDGLISNPQWIFGFDFGFFSPEQLFLRLLAKCGWQDNKRPPEHVFRDSAFMHHDASIVYNLQCNDRFISLMCKQTGAVDDGKMMEFLFHINSLLKAVCWKFFNFLEYRLDSVCLCSFDDVMDGRWSKADLHTIVDYRLKETFPTGVKRYFVCKKRSSRRTIVDFTPFKTFRANSAVINDSDLTQAPPVHRRSDLFISCTQHAREFVQTCILPIVENPQGFWYLLDDNMQENLPTHGSSCFVDYRDPTVNHLALEDWSALLFHVVAITNAECFLAIITPDFESDRTCQDEVSVAIERNMRIVPLLLGAKQMPAILINVFPLRFPDDISRESLIEFYTRLLRSLRRP